MPLPPGKNPHCPCSAHCTCGCQDGGTCRCQGGPKNDVCPCGCCSGCKCNAHKGATCKCSETGSQCCPDCPCGHEAEKPTPPPEKSAPEVQNFGVDRDKLCPRERVTRCGVEVSVDSVPNDGVMPFIVGVGKQACDVLRGHAFVGYRVQLYDDPNDPMLRGKYAPGVYVVQPDGVVKYEKSDCVLDDLLAFLRGKPSPGPAPGPDVPAAGVPLWLVVAIVLGLLFLRRT